MTTKSFLTARGARYVGEKGFFADNPMAQEDLALVRNGEEVIVRWYSVRNLEALKYLWGLVYKVANATDRWVDYKEGMKDLKMRAAFARLVYNPQEKKLEWRTKSLSRITNEELRSLTNKISNIIIAEVLPHMKPNQLRREVEEMLGMRGEANET